jgi:hypothetical protein
MLHDFYSDVMRQLEPRDKTVARTNMHLVDPYLRKTQRDPDNYYNHVADAVQNVTTRGVFKACSSSRGSQLPLA